MDRVVVGLVAALLTALHPMTAGGTGGVPLYTIEFAAERAEPSTWLRAEGFEVKLRAQQLETSFSDRGLVLETDGEDAALFVKELDLPRAKRVRVIWGVDRYPDGVDWEAGNRRVPLALMFWLGDEKIDSGGLFVPDSPYFTGLFLGANEQEGKPYTGRYYKKGGRYFCQPCETREGDVVVTEFDLEDAFKRSFGSDEMPPLSGFGFQVNTNGTSGGSRAFIKRVEFLTGS